MNNLKRVEKRDIEDIIALTPTQEGILFHYLKDPGSDLYFEQLSLEISGEIDLEHFEKAWNVVIETNEMLRTVFRWEKIENPIQIVLKEHKLQPAFYDVIGGEDNEWKRKTKEIKEKDRQAKFNLQEVPFRVTLCKIAGDKYEMIISNHHILYDGWSNGIILKEFFNAYRLSCGGEIAIAPLKPSFKEFVKWIRRQDTGKQENFWNTYLKDFGIPPGKNVPPKRKKRKEIKNTGNYRFKFPPGIKKKLAGLVKGLNITTASFLYSVWGVLLHNYNSTGDAVFDTTVSGRSAKIKGIEDIVGLFINTLPLRVRVQTSSNERVPAFLSRMHQELTQWSEFENSSPGPVREYLDKCYNESLFDSVVVIENYPLDRISMQETAPLSIHSFAITEITLYDLTVIVTIFDDIEFNITYNKDLFEEGIISRLFGHLLSIAAEMTANPRKIVSEIKVLSDVERKKFREHIDAAQQMEPAAEFDYAAPRSALEEKLTGVWSKVLDIPGDVIGIDNNFFDFGGHSLKASLMASRIHRAFDVKIPLVEMFNRPTIRGMAGYISRAVKQEYIPIAGVEKKDHYAVSSAQKRMYMLQQLNPGSTAYNGPWMVILEGPVDEERIGRSFKGLIERQEMLRTSFERRKGEPVQKIHNHDHVEFEIEYFDGPSLPVIKDFLRPFDLSKAPLLRVGLIKEGEQRYSLVVDMHHIITDGTSTAVLTGELAVLYKGDGLPPLKIQYKDFSQWQNERLAEGKLKKQEDYWLEHLSGELPVLNLPIDFPRPPMQSFEGERISFEPGDDLCRRLYMLMKETGTTLYMVLTAVFNVLLSWYSGQEDMVVGTTISGRNHGDLENAVGFFLETQAIRYRPRGEKTFTDFLKEVKHTSLAVNENRDYPFGRLIRQLSPVNDWSRNPLFDVMVNLLNQTGTPFELEGVKSVPYPLDWKVSKVDITLEAVEEKDKVKLELEYCTALFKRDTMARMARHFLNTMGGAVFNPEVRLGEMEIISGAEKRQILEEFNNTFVQHGDGKTVIQYFEGQVEKTPDHIALIGPCLSPGAIDELPRQTTYITYKEANEKSRRLAYFLREKGVAPNTITAIMVERSVEMITGILGILKAGGAYLPIDPDYPGERIDFILKDSGVNMLVTPREILAEPCVKAKHLHSHGGVNANASPHHMAYIIYTSGSTGRPRGVMVKHRNLMAYLHSFREEFRIKETDVVIQQASFSFDAFVEEVYACLLAGGSLALPPRGVIRDTALLVDFIAAHKVNIIDCSPLLLNELNEWVRVGATNPLKTIHTFISGGDVLKGEYVDNLLKIGTVYNTYGPTETTVCATYHRLTGTEGSSIPIGKPIANYRVYILDGYRRLLPVGVVGEICICGVGVTGGYLNQPELTHEKYIDFPEPGNFPELEQSAMYRTGDLGKWLPGGGIEFIGRKDRQVKIRGFRIELGEIEAQLLAHEDINEVAVVDTGDHTVCAYFTALKEKNVREMREFLSLRLPGYMIPSHFVRLGRLPLSPGGKIDLKALPKPSDYSLDTGAEYVSPQNEIEIQLVNMWQELLGRDRIGVMDDFFDLGGDSIQVNRCIALIRESLKVEISLRKFFEQPYIKSLAEEIEKDIDNREQRLFSIPRASREGDIPLSFPQERLWFLQSLDEDNAAYFVPRVFRIIGKLEARLVERTFTEIIRRHEILRTAFVTRDGMPFQQVREPYYFKIPTINLGREEVANWIKAEGRKVFDFEKGTLLRVTLLKLRESEHLLVLTEHHLVHDGWTQGVLLREFITIFSAYSEGRDHDFPELPIQYADFAVWQRESLQGERLNHHLDYWKKKLSGLIPLLELPCDRPRPAVISGNGALKEFHLPGAVTRQLEEFSRNNGVTLFMVMLAVFKTLLYRYSGQEDLCIGTGIANRGYKEMEGMLGMVINTIPLRTHTVGDITFRQYLDRVKETCLEAYQHQDTPFEKTVEALAPERSLGYNPLFQVLFSFMDTPTYDLWLPGLEVHLEPSHNRSAKFDINIVVVPPMEGDNDEILVEWEYNTDIFDDGTVERMTRHYKRLLQETAAGSSDKICSLPMLEDPEIRRLLYDFNKAPEAYPYDKTIHQLFREQVGRTPDSTALVGVGEEAGQENVLLTYNELDKKSGRLAGVLMEKGVLVDTIVGIMVRRSLEMVIGILGILKSGGAYLPISPGYPGERINYMLADSGAKFLLILETDKETKIKKRSIERIAVSKYIAASIPGAAASAANLAYVTYTSGSTGSPKGVMIKHHSVLNCIKGIDNIIQLNGRDRLYSLTTISFDIFGLEIYWPLIKGAKVLLGSSQEQVDIFAAARVLEREKINAFQSTPSRLQFFISSEEVKNALTSLKYLLVGGEEFPAMLLEKTRAIVRGRIYNVYGPTETTIWSTIKDVTGHEALDIGKPIINTQIYILGKGEILVPVGVVGELCIGGEGLARGYLNRLELTAEKFARVVNSRLSPVVSSSKKLFKSTDERIYKTGDLARWQLDGNIEFLGRIDNQVKIRGFRIELGEIENRLLDHEKIKEAVVLGIEDNNDKYLCAYIVAERTAHGAEREEINKLREYLSQSLPDYMIPSYFVQLDKIPLTSNGKVDRKALPFPGIEMEKTYVAPRDDIENKLVGIWFEILGVEKQKISIDANFFHLGGHSLKATVLSSRIHKELNINIPLMEIFKRLNIRGLAAYIKETAESKHIPVEPVEKKQYYPLSSAQRRLYILQQMDVKGGAGYNMPSVWHVDGALAGEKVAGVLRQLILRHESLRTFFTVIDDEPVHRVHEEAVTGHWSLVIGEAGKNEIEEIIKNFIKPFDLSRAPLLRVGLIKIGEKKHILMMDMHHIISDGLSAAILVKEFTELYRGKSLPGLRLQYRDYSEWYNRQLGKEIIKDQEIYWLNQFAGEVPVLDLPLDHPRPAMQDFTGRTIHFEINKEETAAIKSLALEQDITVFMLLLSVYTVFLNKLSGQEDIVVGTPIAGRGHTDLEGIIGMFVNTLALRNFPTAEKTVGRFLKEIKENTIRAFENRDYPYEDLVEQAQVERDTGRNPLFDTMFVLHNMDRPGIRIPGLRVAPYHYESRVSKFDLTLTAVEIEDRLVFTFEYCTNLFKKETIRRFTGFFKQTISNILENHETRIHDIEIITGEEKNRVLHDFNDTGAKYPQDKTIHRLFEEQVERGPDRIAVVGGRETRAGRNNLSYRELNERADQLAGSVISRGVGENQIVGLLVDRSFEMIGGILAAWKVGCAYVPLNPKAPASRSIYMLKECGTDLLLTTRRPAEEIETLKGWEGKTIVIEDQVEDGKDVVPSPPGLPRGGASNFAYIIFTSGSTGNPKGVPITHANLCPLMHWGYKHPGIGSRDRVLANLSYYFDWSVWEMFITLTTGAVLYLVSDELPLNPGVCIPFMKKNGITVLHATPTQFQHLIGGGHKFETLKYLFLGAEKLTVDLLKRSFASIKGDCRVFNMYGPTEATIISAVLEIKRGDESRFEALAGVPIGGPVGNGPLLVLGKYLNLCPVNAAGELYIGGDGVAAGYLNKPGLTAENFLILAAKNAKGREGGRRIYKTGDLVRWLEDGNLEFLGRMDTQVKIRGFRIELGEIENQLLSHEKVREAILIAGESAGSDKYLCAYIVVKGEETTAIEPSELREYLAHRLPDYMIPSYFVQLDQIPVTANGKVNIKAFPAPVSDTHSTNYAPPQTESEVKLVEIWSELLGIKKEKIGIHDNFFELGGHSLKATSMMSKIHKELDIKIELAQIFRNSTISELAQLTAKSNKNRYAQIGMVEKKEYYTLSSAQKRLYFLHMMEESGTGYNMPGVMKLAGRLETEKLENIFYKLIRRHESFRTSFLMVEEEPVQKIRDNISFKLDKSFCGAFFKKRPCGAGTLLGPGGPPEAYIKSFIRPFDLSRAPLLRVGLVETEKEEYLFMVDMHHIISDGTSMGVLVKEFMALYEGRELPCLRLHYKDCAEWETHEQAGIMGQEAYWLREYKDDIPVLDLPLDYLRPGVQRFEGSSLNFEIDGRDTGALKSLALQWGATLYMVLLAAYNIFLAKISSQEVIVVGTPTAGRSHADLEQVIGMFVNTLALKNYPVGEKSIHSFLEEVKEKTLKAFANQDYPYEELVEKVVTDRDAGRNPLFDTMFVLQNQDIPTIETPGLKLKPYPYEQRTSKFDLTLVCIEIDDHLSCTLEYSTGVFKQETILGFTGYFKKIISAVLENPDEKISGIEIISPEERERILFHFNDTGADYPKEKTIHRLFEEQVERRPDSVVLKGNERRPITLTYRELNEKADGLAAYLREKGVLADSIVGIQVERSVEMIVGIFGILKSGGAYLPIDPDYPRQRIDFMLNDSAAGLLLVRGADSLYAEALPEHASTICSHAIRVNGASPAYIIYTSGTTGKPKGIVIKHRSVVNRLYFVKNKYRLDENDVLLQKTPFTFDVSVCELFQWLFHGAKLCLLPTGGESQPGVILDTIARHNVTVIEFVPSMLSVFLEFMTADNAVDKLQSLRWVFVGAEVVRPELAAAFNKAVDGGCKAQLIDAYGPTEATVDITHFNCSDRQPGREPLQVIPIGKPIGNVQVFILDRAGYLRAVGVPGELCIGGDSLAVGYLNNPELTAEKFLILAAKNAKEREGGRRIYKTGDLARWLSDGNIEFLDRIDNQVKIRGFRIELGEIENQLLTHEKVKEATLIAGQGAGSDKYLCAYIVAERTAHGAEREEINKLREYLSQSLPDYMVPAYFVLLDGMPLTANGKIDRKALPEPGIDTHSSGYVPPRDESEVKLVEIWSELLAIETEKIGIHDNFFELGGHSLKATTMMSKIHKELDIKTDLVQIFKHPTISGLAKHIKKSNKNRYARIEPLEKKEYYPLSSGQKRLYIYQQLQPGSTDYNMPAVYRLTGRSDREKFRHIFAQLVQRHEVLRTVFFSIQGEMVQRVVENIDFNVAYWELDEREAKERIRTLIKPFDLNRAPLLRVEIIHTRQEECFIFFDMHHIISDGSSIDILVNGFARLYEGGNLTPLPVQYKDYASWQDKRSKGEKHLAQEKYWLNQLEGFMFTQLPIDHFDSYHRVEGKAEQLAIDTSLYDKIERFCNKHNITKFIFMITVFEIVLAREIEQWDITLGIPASTRDHPDLKDLIGIFLNVLLIRTDIDPNDTFLNHLDKSKKTVFEALNNQDYPYEILKEKIIADSPFKKNELFSILFNYFPGYPDKKTAIPDFQIEPLDLHEISPKFDMTLYLYEKQTRIEINVVYKSNMYNGDSIGRLFRNFLAVIHRVPGYPDLPVSRLTTVTGDNAVLVKEDKEEEFEKYFDEGEP